MEFICYVVTINQETIISNNSYPEGGYLHEMEKLLLDVRLKCFFPVLKFMACKRSYTTSNCMLGNFDEGKVWCWTLIKHLCNRTCTSYNNVCASNNRSDS